MSTAEIPDKYQAIIDHNDYLFLKVRRLEAELIDLRRQLQMAYELMHRARDTAALLEAELHNEAAINE